VSTITQRLRRLRTSAGGIDTQAGLAEHLQVAMELELSTLPPYMCALYSIVDGANLEAAGLVRSVLMEEMLHVSLAANVLNAIGGRPVLARREVLPHYPTALPDGDQSFTVNLQKFSREAIATFLRIELPAAPSAAPQADGYHTIGQFYGAIENGLKRLAKSRAITFTHRPECQVEASDYYNGHGRIITVNSLETALEALNEIRHQGEGISHSVMEDNEPLDQLGYNLAHYFRFMEIAEGRRFQKGDSPRGGPTGPLLPVDWNAVRNMVPNPRAAWYPAGSPIRRQMDDCNACFLLLLQSLEAAFNGDKPRFRQAVPLMLELKQRITGLMNIPSGIADTMLGPSFEWPGSPA
jgi:hypothetical protein